MTVNGTLAKYIEYKCQTKIFTLTAVLTTNAIGNPMRMKTHYVAFKGELLSICTIHSQNIVHYNITV